MRARPVPACRAGVLGLQGAEQGQALAEDTRVHQCVRACSLCVVADGRGQGHDQAREQSCELTRPARPGEPPGEDHHQGGRGHHGDHRGNPQHRGAGPGRHPAVQQQVVQPVHGVHVTQQVRQLSKAQRRRPAAGCLVVAHRRLTGQPPEPEAGHDRGGRGHRRPPDRGRRPARRSRPVRCRGSGRRGPADGAHGRTGAVSRTVLRHSRPPPGETRVPQQPLLNARPRPGGRSTGDW